MLTPSDFAGISQQMPKNSKLSGSQKAKAFTNIWGGAGGGGTVGDGPVPWRPSPQQPTRPTAKMTGAQALSTAFGTPMPSPAQKPAPQRTTSSGGGGGSMGGMTANQLQARMTREQFADFENRLAPMLDSLYRENNNPRAFGTAAFKAASEASRANSAAQGVMGRQMQQYGRGMTADQRRAMATQMQIGGAANMAGAATSARGRVKDQQMATRMDLLGIEQGLADNANEAASSAAQMETGRNEQNNALRNQRKSQKAQTFGSLLGLGLLALSSEAFKHEIEELRDTPADKLLDSFTIKTFRYKPEVGLGDRLWIGPIVEELPDVLKDEDGIFMNMYNAVGLLIDRCQRQEKRIRALEDQINGH